MIERIELQIPPADRKKRLEDFLFDRFHGLSKMYLRDVVKNEKCEVNGRYENVGYRVRENDFIEIELDISRENAMRPQEMELDIVYEDEQLIVVNKPAGMLVHPTHRDKSGTLLNGLAFYLNRSVPSAVAVGRAILSSDSDFISGAVAFALPVTSVSTTPSAEAADSPPNQGGEFASGAARIRPGLVHRLDKQTSGLIVVAKTSRAHRILADHFHRKLVEKRYLALVEGTVKKDEGTIEGTIGRYAEEKRWDIKPGGKRAETRFWVRERYADTTLLELEPVTGRTNQLRIHCASIGHPIVGDIARGGRHFERLCLHASRLSFRHPNGGKISEFSATVAFSVASSK